MWSEWGVSSSVFTVDRTLYCASGVCPGGRSWRGYSAVNSVYSSTLSLFDKWEPRLIPTLHAATLPTQHFNAPAKNRPDFLKTSYLFTARLQSPVLSLPLCCIDFLLTKKTQNKNPSVLYPSYGSDPLPNYCIYIQCWRSNSALNVNTFAWQSSWGNRKQCLQYINTSKFVKMLRRRTLVRRSRSECFSLLGCQTQPCEQRGCRLEDRQLSSWRFHHAWFPELLSSLVISSF